MVSENLDQGSTFVSAAESGSTRSQQRSVLVLGAGELGMAVLRHLAQRATAAPELALSVLLRSENDPSTDLRKRKQFVELKSLGVRIIFGDLAQDSEAELATTFGNFDNVIGCTGFVVGRNIQFKLARAALAGGVKRYLPWQFGVDYDVIGRGSAQDLFDEQLDVRDLLRSQQTTEWIVVSTGMFTSFLFEPSFGVVDLPRNTVHALGSWENSVTVTTAEDIGKLTAEILLAEPSIRNTVVYTAEDTVTYARLADIIDHALHRKVERVLWTIPMLKQRLAEDPSDALSKYRVVFAEGRGVAWPMDNTFNAQHAVSVVSIERWMQEHLRPEPH